jgi:hypothetical protein
MDNKFIKIREFTFTYGDNIMIDLPCHYDEHYNKTNHEYNDGTLYFHTNCIITFYEYERTCDVEYNEKLAEQYIEDDTHSFLKINEWDHDIHELITVYYEIYTEYRIFINNNNGTQKIYCTKIKPTIITLDDILSDE